MKLFLSLAFFGRVFTLPDCLARMVSARGFL